MNSADFANAFLIALNDESIKKALVDIMTQGVSEPVSQRVTESLTNQITSLKKDLKERDRTIAKLQEHIDGLTTEVDRLEQYTRRNSIRISGIPEPKEDNPTAKVLDLMNNSLKLTPPLTLAEVDRIHRVGIPKSQRNGPAASTRTPPRQILVKLATYRTRKRIMDLRGELKDVNKDVYISEDLTKARSELLYEARVLKRSKKINGAWSADGNILILDKNNKVVTIKCKADLRDY